VVDRLLGDPLTGREDRDTGWVRAHHLGDDAAHGLLDRHLLDPGEERVPGAHDALELQ
jgi:hypothetical protein